MNEGRMELLILTTLGLVKSLENVCINKKNLSILPHSKKSQISLATEHKT